MKMLTVAYYTFLMHLRDYKTLLFLTIVPLIMIPLIGFTSDSKPQPIKPIELGLAIEAPGQIADQLLGFLNSEQLDAYANLTTYDSLEEGREQAQSGAIESLFVVNESGVEQYSRNEKPMSMLWVRTFMDALNQQGEYQTVNEPAIASAGSFIQETKYVTEGKVPYGLDYYSVLTLFQFLLFGALIGVFSVMKDSTQNLHLRLLGAPIRPAAITAGKLLGGVSILFLSTIITVTFLSQVYGANWSGSPIVIGGTLLIFCFYTIGLGMFVAYMTRSNVISAAIIFSISLTFTTASGGFNRVVPPVLDAISHFSPNHYAREALFEEIYGFSTMPIGGSLAYMTAMAAGVILLCFAAGRRRSL